MFQVRINHYQGSGGAFRFFERELLEQTHVRSDLPRLQVLGHRFRGVTIDAPGMARLGAQIQQDGERCPRGTFAFLRFDLEPGLTNALLAVPAAEVEERLLRAAGEALTGLPGREGLYYVALEGGNHEVRALLSPRRSDDQTAKALGRVDLQGLEAAWHSRSHATFQARPRVEVSARGQEIQERWKAAIGDVQKAVGARMRGEIDQPTLRAALDRAESFRREWHARALPPAPVRQAEIVPLTVESGREFLHPLGFDGQREVLTRAAAEAAGEGAPAPEVVHVERPNGDLKALVRLPPAASEAHRAQIAERFAPALREEAGRHPDWAPRSELGPIRTGGPAALVIELHFEGGQKVLARLGSTPRDPETRQAVLIERLGPALREATREALGPASLSVIPAYQFSFPKAGHIRVRVDMQAGPGPTERAAAEGLLASLTRDLPRLTEEALAREYGLRLSEGTIRVGSRPPNDRTEGPAKPQPRHVSRAERLGPGGDIHMVRFRVERGIDYVAGLPIPQQQEILGNAAAKAFPGLREGGFRPQVQAQQEGAALLVRVTVPHAYLWDRDLIPSPATQARFANEVYRLGGQLQNRFTGEILPVRPEAAPRGPIRVPVADRAASKTLTRETLDRLGRLAPAALRTGRTILRWAERLLPLED